MPFLLETPRQQSMFQVFGRAPIWFALCTVYAAVTYYLAPISLWLVFSFLGVGAVAAGLVVLSLRYYNYWLSWAFWAIPVPAALAALILIPVRDGAVHPLQALILPPGIAGAAAFGLLWLFRRWLVKWVR